MIQKTVTLNAVCINRFSLAVGIDLHRYTKNMQGKERKTPTSYPATLQQFFPFEFLRPLHAVGGFVSANITIGAEQRKNGQR